jgi:penicillin-binding protein 1A
MSSRKKRAKQQPKRHIIPFTFIFIVAVLVGLVGFTTAGAFAMVESWLTDLPGLEGVGDFNNARKTRVVTEDGTLLGEFYAQDREPVTADQVSPNLFKATVDIEDERFWEHQGVDYYGIARAAVNDLLGGGIQGASTITQQLVRQTVLQEEANDITLERKVREAYLALELEKQYTKEEVLMMYINSINYGDGAWGIQSAAKHYFSKDASELSVTEAALLAGIPQNPTYNNPVDYPDNALARRNMVLDRMYVNNDITEQELDEAKASELGLNVRSTQEDGIYLVPYFTSYVKHVLLNEMEKYDMDYKRVYEEGGLTVYTTIDLQMQEYAEEACAAKEANLDEDAEVSLATVDPNNGYIKAMRGGKDYYGESQFNTCWQMQRQSGSTAKVFALTAAIEEGYSPSTRVSGASPVTIDMGPGVEPWKPANYGGASYGIMSLAQATWQSSNTAYARVVRKIGAEPLVDVAHRLGIKTDIQPNLSVVLGAEGVNTLEMASAFGTLGVGGVYHEPTAIAKIVDYEGNVLYDHNDHMEGERAVSPEVAYAVTEVLKGVVTGGTGTAARLASGQVAAGKTGTADEFKDSMFVGYTPQLSTAVWIGVREYPRYLPDNVGGDNCCPVWRAFMTKALANYELADFPSADNPPYDPKATFMTAEEIKKQEEEEKKKKEEEEAKKKAEEEAAKKKAEEEAAKNKPPTGGTGTNPGTGTGGTGGTGTGTGGTGTGGGTGGTGTGSGGTGGTGTGSGGTGTGTGGTGTGTGTGGG